MRPVPPPATAMGRWPARCSQAMAIIPMRWPMWREAAVGSKPT